MHKLPLINATEELHPIIACRGTSIAIQAAEGSTPENPGYPKLVANSYNGGPLRVPGYSLPVVVDLDTLQGLDKPHAIYREHDKDRILGAGSTTRQGNSLMTTGEMTNQNADVEEVARLGKTNFPFEASLGVQPLGLVKVEKGQSVTVNGMVQAGPLLVARPAKLKEVSVVQHGADDTTSLQVAASLSLGDRDVNFSTWLKAGGWDEATLSEGQLKILKASFEAEQSNEGQQTSSVDQVLASARNRESRHAAYGRIIQSAIERGMDTETAEKLVTAAQSDNLNETDFELRVLRATRFNGNTIVASRSNDVTGEVIEASLAKSAGIREEQLQKLYSPEVIRASERQFKHGLSLVETLMLAARRNGHRDISHRDTRALLTAAFAPVQAAGPSTYDVGGILSNVANKMILNGFNAVEQEWTKIATIGTVNDLKKHSSYALTGDMTYKLIGKQGELEHATLGEQKYENQASTYGRIFGISEDDIINDDLGAFQRIQRMLGRGSALALNKVVWTEFLRDASTFWATGRKNYLSGGTSVLSIDALSKAVTALEKQTDPDGEPLGVMGAVLVVPTDLKILGMQLASDPEIRKTSAGSDVVTYSINNPHAGKFTLAASAYLNNATISGGSASAWWLMADPQDLPTLEVVFLNGQQSPRVEQGRADFDTLGINMRGVHRFGAAKQEYRASVYSAGA